MALSQQEIKEFRSRVNKGDQVMNMGRRIGTVSKREGDKLLVVWADRMTSFKAFEYWRTLAVARRLGLENEIQRQFDREMKNIIAETEDGPCKVVISDYPSKRLASLQIGNPRCLSIFSLFGGYTRREAKDLEGWVHSALYLSHIRGEWFDANADEIESIIDKVIKDAK